MKTMYIISGCNGAGKTTASMSILPEILQCREFVNADEIAKGLSPFNPESVAIEAGRLMLQRIATLIEGNVSFAIETTLATKSYVKLVEKAHQNGFFVQLLFFWLETPEAAVKRVAKRVSEGGHNIETDVILRRYMAGISNFQNLFRNKVDMWLLVDNETNPRRIIAQGNPNHETIEDVELYNKFLAYVGRTV
ncbi:MAG: zeta toxin family protein [Bacteroidales bacterium]|nr:zeta toxin family protein [Bacteroidales bacterium]